MPYSLGRNQRKGERFALCPRAGRTEQMWLAEQRTSSCLTTLPEVQQSPGRVARSPRMGAVRAATSSPQSASQLHLTVDGSLRGVPLVLTFMDQQN